MCHAASRSHLRRGFLIAQWSRGAWPGNICAGKGGAWCCAWPPAYAVQEARPGDVHPHFPAELDGVRVPPPSLLGPTKSRVFLL